MTKQMTFATERAQQRLARIADMLTVFNMTSAQVALVAHISKRWAYPYLDHLHGQRLIRIAGWRINRQGGDHSPVYGPGGLPDVPKPECKSWLVKAREYRARVKADKDRNDVYLSKKRAKARKPKGDPLHVWIPKKPTKGQHENN